MFFEKYLFWIGVFYCVCFCILKVWNWKQQIYIVFSRIIADTPPKLNGINGNLFVHLRRFIATGQQAYIFFFSV